MLNICPIPFWQKALELGDKEFGGDNPTTAILLTNLGKLYQSLGRYADAEPLYKRALVLREKALGPDHSNVAASLS